MTENKQPRDFSNWMANLSKEVTEKPLFCLTIPGSHNSFSYDLDPTSEAGADNSILLQMIINLFGSFAKGITYRWSVTQTLNLTEQLQAGIRYLDFRVAYRESADGLYVVHGLYGQKVKGYLDEVNRFLQKHPKEVILLDFNHFYSFNTSHHKQLLKLLQVTFGEKLCPCKDIHTVTLDSMWKDEYQVICFYQKPIVEVYHQFWPARSIYSLWADAHNAGDLIHCLETNYKSGHCRNIFFVWQGVVTPTLKDVILNFRGCLKDLICKKADPAFIQWLQNKKGGSEGITACDMDFVETSNYIETLINMNKSLPNKT